MQTQNVDLLIDQANQLLHAANEELQRSQEDVTAFTVCYNSRQSIVNYLLSFLIKNEIDLIKPVTIASLMDQCREVDNRFRMIDISEIYCNHDENDEEYCLNIDKVSDCLRIARQTRDIAITQSPPY